MNWSKAEIEDVLRRINIEAQTNKEFRTLCLTDPVAAIQTMSEKQIPKGFVVRFIENEDAHLTHVLPDFIERNKEELTDRELNQIAGGGIINKICSKCGSSEKQIWENGLCSDCLG